MRVVKAKPFDLFFDGDGKVDGILPPELDHDPVILVLFEDIHDVLELHGLEEEAVGGVEIRGDGLRVVVDDMDLHPLLFPEGLDCMDGAVIELDTLADPDRSGTEDEHFFGVGWNNLAVRFIR